MKTDPKQIYREAFWIGSTPDEMMKVSEWADKYRVLSSVGSAEPGPFRTSRTPYLKQIMDDLSPDSDIEEVIVQKGAQVGYTEGLVNFLGFIIDVTSGPALLVQPTVDLAKRFSKQRVDPLIEFSERIGMKVSETRIRDSGNTMLQKEFPGGILVMTGANSAAGLRSLPARFLCMDECDAYPKDVDGEGDPMLLARARTRTFSRRKIIQGSTPTFSGRSAIESAFLDSNQLYFFVPCPHCGEMQEINWGKIKWDPDHPETAHMQCDGCRKKILEHHKTDMLAGGEWVSKNPTHPNKRRNGYHISALYSPVGWYSWAQAAKDFLESKDKPEKLRGFVNTVLGETWKDRGDAPEWKRIYEGREIYTMGKVPMGGVLLTAGADVQKDRIEVEILAWGPGKESWSIDYRIFMGDTSSLQSDAWKGLSSILDERFEHESGCDLSIRTLAVDSGFNTQTVYNWARQYPGNRVMATKGIDNAAVMLGIPSAVDVNMVKGAKIKKGFRIWPIGVNIAKTELYGWLKLERPTDGNAYPLGYCHFPQYSEEYFLQLTAEQLVVRLVRGYSRHIWEKTRERNEALDCRILNRVAAASAGLDRLKPEHWTALRANLGIVEGKVGDENPRVVGSHLKTSQSIEQVRRKSDYL